MPEYRYVWLFWSAAFLVPWAVLYAMSPGLRRRMLRVSAATSLLGLTEPIFVPRYWNPPTVFDLAQRTGFDLESLVFCFAIGGIASVLYEAFSRREARTPAPAERDLARHRLHALALTIPYLAFPLLYVLPWNPIYAGIAALALGAVANVLCRPDLGHRTVLGGLLFLGLYAVFMVMLVVFVPGYIQQVWNLPALSGVLVLGIPLEELAFGFSFGTYWAGIYEHFTWRQSASRGVAGSFQSFQRGQHG
jgi:hypothetical protein